MVSSLSRNFVRTVYATPFKRLSLIHRNSCVTLVSNRMYSNRLTGTAPSQLPSPGEPHYNLNWVRTLEKMEHISKAEMDKDSIFYPQWKRRETFEKIEKLYLESIRINEELEREIKNLVALYKEK